MSNLGNCGLDGKYLMPSKSTNSGKFSNYGLQRWANCKFQGAFGPAEFCAWVVKNYFSVKISLLPKLNCDDGQSREGNVQYHWVECISYSDVDPDDIPPH